MFSKMRDKAARGQLCNSTINTNNKVLQTSCDKHIIKPVIVLPLDAIMLMFVSQDITDRFTVSHYCIRIQIEGEETATVVQLSRFTHKWLTLTWGNCISVSLWLLTLKVRWKRKRKGSFGRRFLGLAACQRLFWHHVPIGSPFTRSPLIIHWRTMRNLLDWAGFRAIYCSPVGVTHFPVHTIQHIPDCNHNPKSMTHTSRCKNRVQLCWQ